MKSWKPRMALVGLLLLVAVFASADYNARDNATHYQNASTGLRVTSLGHLTTVEQDPAMDGNLTFASIISNSGLAFGAADSSAILDTHRIRLGMLLIKPVPGGAGTVDTATVARLIFQVRTHLNGQADSSSTFALYSYGKNDMGASAASAQTDTTQQGHIVDGVPLTAQLATPSAQTAWSGEFTVLVSGKRSAHGNSIAINGHTYYYPNGIAIPLSSILGREVWSPYTSVRVRVAAIYKAGVPVATGTVAVGVHLVGTPL